jgi:hypothetical protein
VIGEVLELDTSNLVEIGNKQALSDVMSESEQLQTRPK